MVEYLVEEGTTETIESAETEYGNPLNVAGTLNLDGTFNITNGKLKASGIGVGIGTATMSRTRGFTASGIGAGVGTATVTANRPLTATGIGAGVGSADLILVEPSIRVDEFNLVWRIDDLQLESTGYESN